MNETKVSVIPGVLWGLITFCVFLILFNRTLSDVRSECVTVSRRLHVACVNFEARVTEESTCSTVEVSALKKQLNEKLKEAMRLQTQWEAEKIELNSR